MATAKHAARAYTNLATFAARQPRTVAARVGVADGIAFCDKYELGAWGQIHDGIACQHFAGARRSDGGCQRCGSGCAPSRNIAPISKIPALCVLGLLRARRGEPDADVLLE